MGDTSLHILETLRSYKKLAEDRQSHQQLLKDKTVILYAATLLENKNENIVRICLDIFNELADNENCHSALLNTFGIFEAVESLSIKLRTTNSTLSKYATEIINKLRANAPPAYRTRLRVQNNRNYRKMSYMYLLYIDDLDEYNRKKFDETLVQIRGIISFVVDMTQKRCTIRIGLKINIKTIVSKIVASCGLKALIVSKNIVDNVEEYIDVLQDANKTIAAPEYFPEEESPPKGKSIASFKNITKNASGWLKTAVDTWNKSFYW